MMSITTAISSTCDNVSLVPFEESHASEIASWVDSDTELRWLAPSTPPPLTPAKVVAWKKDNGRAMVLTQIDDGRIIGYGELNPMTTDPRHLWLGHITVHPEMRGCGMGKMLVQRLLEEARDRHAAKMISLVVFPDNINAIGCYWRVGFRAAGEESHSFNGGPKMRLLRLEYYYG